MTDLDHFETALLGELRRHVAERADQPDRPGSTPVGVAPSGRPHRWRRWAAGTAAAGAAAAAVVVAGVGGVGGPVPAYAVSQDDAGDVTVTIHRLEDAAGLQATLQADGIDATVSYDQDPGFSFEGPVGDGGSGSASGSFEFDMTTSRGPLSPLHPHPVGMACAFDPAPATLVHSGDDWVLTIPADSPLQDTPVSLGTYPGGDLSLAYHGTGTGDVSFCGLIATQE